MPLDGTLDTSFGTNGIVVTDFSGNSTSEANSVAIDLSNNIIVAGYNSDPYALAKYDQSGNLVTSFGTNGVVVTDFSGNSFSEARSVTIDQNNNIIVAGYIYFLNTNNTDYALAKYDQSGNLVTSFGTNGVVVTDFSGNNYDSVAYSVVIDQNNNIIVAGYNYINNYDYALAKYDQSGNLVTSFGTNGIIVTDFSGNSADSEARSVAIDQNNNIIVAGYNYINNYDYALAKYDQSGNLITSFGTNGVVVTDFSGNSTSGANSVAIDQNNNIIVAGFNFINSYDYALAKYDQSGNLVTSFGTNGIIVTDFSGNSTSTAYSVAIDQNNNIIVAGYNYINNYDYALAKYDQSGNLVTSFGTNGIVVSDFSGNSTSYINSVAIDQNNNIIVAGYNDYDYALAKYYNLDLPISNICFVKGTPIMTDQGPIAIEKINPEKHTIRNKSIVGVTNTVYSSNKYLICFEKDSLGKNIPSQKTITSENHKIFYKGQMIKAKEFVEFLKGVSKIDYKGEVLYNVLMEEYEKIIVNNMICETLDPRSNIAKLYKMCQGLTYEEQNKMILSYNNWFKQQQNNNIIRK